MCELRLKQVQKIFSVRAGWHSAKHDNGFKLLKLPGNIQCVSGEGVRRRIIMIEYSTLEKNPLLNLVIKDLMKRKFKSDQKLSRIVNI